MNLSNDQPCPACGRYKNRPVAIDSLIIKDDQLLLIKRGAEPCKNMWALPAGMLDFDQTAEDTIKKAVEKEVGLQVTSSTFLKVYSSPTRDPNQIISLTYVVEAEGKPNASGDAALCQFFSLDNLPDVMAFDHKQIIKDYIAYQNK